MKIILTKLALYEVSSMAKVTTVRSPASSPEQPTPEPTPGPEPDNPVKVEPLPKPSENS